MFDMNIIKKHVRHRKLIIVLGLSSLAVTLGLMQAQAQSNVPTVIDESCWVESFNDEFDTLDLWNAQTGEGQWKTSYIWDRQTIINNELQFYIDPIEHGISPFSVNNSVLTITADKTPSALKNRVSDQPYVSGVLTSENGFSQKYGRFEALAKVPNGKGLWSAFWLLPSFDQWPQGVAVLPEIDVMESLGHEYATYHTTLHTNQNGPLESHPYSQNVKTDISQDFHLYSVVWTPESLNWYFDKRLVASHKTPRDFTKPVHFLLNLAVGGTWPGSPNSQTVFPARYQVDYVRAYTSRCN